MPDDLIERLDDFAARLLEDAEREPKEGEPPVTLKERIEAFKAVTAFLDKRGARPAGDGKAADKKDDGDTASEPTILRLQRQVNRRRRA